MEDHDLTLTDIKLHAKNFKTRVGKDNSSVRYLAVVIPNGQEVRMAEEGWRVRKATAKNDLIVPFFRVYIPVDFDVSKITLNGKPLSPEDGLKEFDNLELLSGTMKIYGRYGRYWETTDSKKKAIKAFLAELDVVSLDRYLVEGTTS